MVGFFSQMGFQLYLCSQKLQGSSGDGVGDRGDRRTCRWLSISRAPNPGLGAFTCINSYFSYPHLPPVEPRRDKDRDSCLLGALLCPWGLETAPLSSHPEFFLPRPLLLTFPLCSPSWTLNPKSRIEERRRLESSAGMGGPVAICAGRGGASGLGSWRRSVCGPARVQPECPRSCTACLNVEILPCLLVNCSWPAPSTIMTPP